MKRLALALVFLLSCASAWGDPSIGVYVDGSKVTFDVPPVMFRGNVMVPLRGVFEKMGAKVRYSASSGVITAQRADTTVEIKVGDPFARINGESVPMLTPAGMMRDRAFVPLRFLSQALGLDVNWDPNQSVVHITTKTETPEKPPDD